jgi:hypothetical protein
MNERQYFNIGRKFERCMDELICFPAEWTDKLLWSTDDLPKRKKEFISLLKEIDSNRNSAMKIAQKYHMMVDKADLKYIEEFPNHLATRTMDLCRGTFGPKITKFCDLIIKSDRSLSRYLLT